MDNAVEEIKPSPLPRQKPEQYGTVFGTMWKLMPALTIQHIMPCMNLTKPLEIYMLPGQMEEEAWTYPRPLPLVSK